MSEQKFSWESVKAEGAGLLDKIRDLIRQGNVRRIVVEHEGRTVAEFPLTVGVVGVVLAPVAAAVGAIVALLKDCTVKVEREVPPKTDEPASDDEAPPPL